MSDNNRNVRDNRRTAVSERDVIKNAPSRYRRRRRGVNMAAVLLTVLLVSALAASCIHIARISHDAIEAKKESIAEEINFGKEETALPEKEPLKYESVILSAEEIYSGDLILVNYETP